MRSSDVLTEYSDLRRDLAARLKSAQALLSDLTRTTQVFSAYGMSAPAIADKVAEKLAELDTEAAGIADAIDALAAARRDAQRAIGRLESPAHREVLTLRHLAGMTVAEIAERQGISRVAAYARYDAALAMLDAVLLPPTQK